MSLNTAFVLFVLFSICWIYKTSDLSYLSWYFIFLIIFSGVWEDFQCFVLQITDVIFYILYSGLDHFQRKFAFYCIFPLHYFCITFSYIFIYLPNSQPLTWVCNFISSQIYGKHQEIHLNLFSQMHTIHLQSIFKGSFFLLFIFSWIKRGLFACLIINKVAKLSLDLLPVYLVIIRIIIISRRTEWHVFGSTYCYSWKNSALWDDKVDYYEQIKVNGEGAGA